MNRKVLKIVSLLLFLTGFTFFACSKANTFIRILGTWDRVNVIDLNSDEYEEWRFDVDDVLLIRGYSKADPTTPLYTWEGRYHVKVKFTKRYIDISDFGGTGLDYMNDRWDIVKSNNNILIIAAGKQGGLVIREFTKKKN